MAFSYIYACVCMCVFVRVCVCVCMCASLIVSFEFVGERVTSVLCLYQKHTCQINQMSCGWFSDVLRSGEAAMRRSM